MALMAFQKDKPKHLHFVAPRRVKDDDNAEENYLADSVNIQVGTATCCIV